MPLKRRKCRFIARKELHQVRWGGFCLTIRLFPFRGWQPIALDRMFPVKAQVWPMPPLETVT